jgi:hypothetical protein
MRSIFTPSVSDKYEATHALGPIVPEQLSAVTDIIDDAAKRIERL